jgi:hypothetical protein
LEVNQGEKAHFWHVAHYCATHVLAQMSVNSNGSSEIPAKKWDRGRDVSLDTITINYPNPYHLLSEQGFNIIEEYYLFCCCTSYRY